MVQINSYLLEIIEGLKQIYNEFKDFFWGVGYFGWQIAVIYAFIVCYYEDTGYIILFVLLFTLSGLFNKQMKQWIKDLRPLYYIPYLSSEKIFKRKNGMPSGHTQITSFALVIAYLFSHKYLYESIALFSIVFIQRLVFKNHTFLQLIAGGLIGSLLGYVSFYLMRYIENKFETKQTDQNKILKTSII
jgi:membrane-associated phospholipid phosphatase